MESLVPPLRVVVEFRTQQVEGASFRQCFSNGRYPFLADLFRLAIVVLGIEKLDRDANPTQFSD